MCSLNAAFFILKCISLSCCQNYPCHCFSARKGVGVNLLHHFLNGHCEIHFLKCAFFGYESEEHFAYQITSLTKIVHEARFSRYLTNELAQFVVGIQACRRRVLKLLSENRPHSPPSRLFSTTQLLASFSKKCC